MDDRTRGRRRARWTTGTLVALSLAGTAGVGVAVKADPALSAAGASTGTSAGTRTPSNTSTAIPTTTSGTGSTHATTAGS